MSDKLGRRPVIVAGMLLFAAGSLLAAQSESAAGLVLGRALQGAGAVSAAITALVADLTRIEVRTRAMALIGVTIGGSFVLALAVGPVLAAWLGIPGLFQATAVLAVVAAAGVAFAVPSPPRASQPVTTLRALGEAIGNGALLRLDFGIFVLHMVLTASFVAVPFALDRVATAGLASHGRFYLLALALSIVPTVALVLINERSQRPPLLMGLAILLVVAAELLLFVSGGARWGLLLALSVFFSGFNFLEARLPARMTELAETGARGAALGVYATSQFLGAFAGGLLGGWLLGASGEGAVYLMCAAAAGLWWVLVSTAEPTPSRDR
jgi:predicted MFS family arabinose efflux permease